MDNDNHQNKTEARREIKLSLNLTNLCCSMYGIDFYEEDWSASMFSYFKTKILFVTSVLAIVWITFGELVYIIALILNSPRLEDVVGIIHLNGYVWISITKLATTWYKKDVFKKLLGELEIIWPIQPLDEDQEAIKQNSLSGLRLTHLWYFWLNVTALWSYILTPAIIHIYLTQSGQEVELDSPWFILYPYDKHAPILRELTFVCEIFMGLTAVWTMVGSDLLFTALASHIGMMLRLLNLRLRNIAPPAPLELRGLGLVPADHFDEIVDNIKIHQKLIGYCAEIEDGFSFIFLINIMLSSVNICCAGFSCVLLEPPMSLSNKVFLVASLYQIGVLCWYGDDIYKTSAEVGLSVYTGGWYRCDTRSRNALRFLMHRTQKPITFTALKFKHINLVTYTSILTTSYSYFALLNTVYKKKISESN